MVLSRRETLKLFGLGGASVLGNAFLPKFFMKEAHAQSAVPFKLVHVFLGGGADVLALLQCASGLEYDAFRRHRPTLAKDPANLAMITNELGFHPSMTTFRDLFLAGEASTGQTCGVFRNQSGAHDTATFHTISGVLDGNASAASMALKGFGATILDKKFAGRPAPDLLALDFAGGNSILNDIIAQVIKAGNLSNLGYSGQVVGDRDFTLRLINSFANTATGTQPERVRKTIKALETTQARIRAAVQGTTFVENFPNTGIGQAFRQAYIGLSNFADQMECVTMGQGGYDTHGQQDPLNQTPQNRQGLSQTLFQLNEGLRVFVRNMRNAGLWDHTVVCFSSEFGRTAKENGGNGTDHGKGSFRFYAGGRVNGGQIYGARMQPADFDRGDNSVPVTFSDVFLNNEVSIRMGAGNLYDPSVLAQVPVGPALFRA